MDVAIVTRNDVKVTWSCLSGTVIFGIGGLAQVVASYMGELVVAFTVDEEYIKEDELMGRPVVPFEGVKDFYSPPIYDIFVAVTQQNRHRHLLEQKCEEAIEKDYALTYYIASGAIASIDAVVDAPNSLISPGAIVERNARVSRGVFVRSGAYIGHDTTLSEYAYIAPRACIGGNVYIGKGAFVGYNATIRDGVMVGDGAIIGAGAVVLKDVDPDTVIKASSSILLPISAEDVSI